MAATIEYYFSMISPWAFIGHDVLHDMAARRGAEIDYRPMALLEVFDATDTPRPAKRHATRKAYRMLELQRWRTRRGLDFKLQPAHWPYDFAPADKLVIAIIEAGENPAAFIRAASRATWMEERNLGEKAELIALADAAGLDGAKLMQDAGSEKVETIYGANTKEALAAGVFGSPSYVLNGELFWGQDRLELLEDAIASGRAPYSPTPA